MSYWKFLKEFVKDLTKAKELGVKKHRFRVSTNEFSLLKQQGFDLRRSSDRIFKNDLVRYIDYDTKTRKYSGYAFTAIVEKVKKNEDYFAYIFSIVDEKRADECSSEFMM